MSESWYRDDKQASDANIRNIIRSMVTQIEVPQLFPPRSIPGRAVDFDAATAGSIPTAALADSSVTSAKILDGTIATADLANSSVTPAKTGVVPAARVFNSGNISCGDGTFTTLTFDSETFDTDTIHNTGSNTSRLTATTAGIYVVTGHATFDANATGRRALEIRLDNTSSLALQTVASPGAVNHELSVTTIYALTAGQYVELRAFQNSGGSLNVLATPFFGMAWVGKAV